MSETERPPDATFDHPANGSSAEASVATETQEKESTGATTACSDCDQSPAADAPPVPTAPPTLEERLAAVENEKTKLRDQLLRTAADFDNFRKRSRREAEDAQRRGREGAVKELLPVFDNLERASTVAEGAPDARSVVDGLRIVLKQFKDTLEKMGIRRIPTVASAFDPSVHEAIQHVESPDQPAGTVIAEVQAGYAIGDHLLRAAMVVVSKGPAPSSEPAPP